MLHRHASAGSGALLILSAAIAVCGCADQSDEVFRTVTEADVTPNHDGVATTADSRPAESEADLETSAESRPSRIEVGAVGSDVHRSPEDSLGNVQIPAIHILIPQRQFAPEGPHHALRVSFDDFDLERVLGVTIPEPGVDRLFPDWLNNLAGRRIRVRGFMMPTFRAEGLTQFVLARDTETCCFGPNGKIHHLVSIMLQDGMTTDYIELRPFDVEGIFRIAPVEDGGELLQLYQIDDAVMIKR
jgi:hypothetical protein